MKEYLDIDELSRLIHLSKSQLYMMTSTRKLPHLKVGRRVLFDPEQIERWLDTRRVTA
jgi:excisionase family DNA binding protein